MLLSLQKKNWKKTQKKQKHIKKQPEKNNPLFPKRIQKKNAKKTVKQSNKFHKKITKN